MGDQIAARNQRYEELLRKRKGEPAPATAPKASTDLARLKKAAGEEKEANVAAGRDAIVRGTSYEGTRKNSKGEDVVANLPIRAISRFANIGNDGEQVKPICAWPHQRDFPLGMWESPDATQRNELKEKIRSGEMTSEDVTGGTQLSFAVPNGIAMDPEFAETTGEETAVIVLAASSFEHAMLLFINGSDVWTCGYGYYGSASEADATWKDNLIKLLKKIPGIKDKPADFREAFAHKFETLQGALYTADYLLPSYTQAANIVWVGFMDQGMKDRLKTYLGTVSIVQVKTTGSCNKKKCQNVTATNHLTLYVGGSYYQEAAAWMSRGLDGEVKWNCLEWVKHILGQDLQCGLLSAPSSCNSVSQVQWENLTKNGFPNINSPTVHEVQGALLKKDIASVVGSAASLATSNPRSTAACLGGAAACAAAASPLPITGITPMAAALGTGTCTTVGCVTGVLSHEVARRAFNEKMSDDSPQAPPPQAPPQQIMSRITRKTGKTGKTKKIGGGRKTRRKRKKRRTRNKHKRRKKKRRRTRYKKKKHRRKRRTRR